MATPQALTGQQIIGLLRRFHELQISWQVEDIAKISDHFGWSTSVARKAGAAFQTELPRVTAKVDVGSLENVINIISVPVCGFIDTESSMHRAWLQDLFGQTVNAGKEEFGDPSDLLPGELPEVRWREPQAIFGVRRYSTQVNVFMARIGYMDSVDRYEADGD